MRHEHPPEFHQNVIRAVVTGEPFTLPDCCVDELIEMAKELLDDDRVLSAEFVG